MGEIRTLPARIVWGNPIKGVEARDTVTRQPRMRDGKPIIQHKMGLAIPKHEFTPIFQEILKETQTIYPQAQWSPTGQHIGVPQGYAWKFVDGDGTGYDDKGQLVRYSDRAGYAGCYVLACSTEIPVLGYKNVNGAYMQWTDIKTGDYVVTPLNIKAHPAVGNQKAGVYVNPLLVEFIGYGEAIVSGPDAQTLLGGQQYQLPPGASATPIAPTGPGAMMPGMQPQPGMMPGGAMQPQPGMMPGGAMQPQPGMMPGGAMQPQPGMMAPQQPGMMPGMQPQPGMMQQQPQPGMMQQQPQPGMMQQQPQPGMMPGGAMPGMPVQPAYDFTGMQPQPGMMPGGAMPGMQPGMMPGMQQQPQPQPGMMPGNGAMPGMMPQR